MLYNKLLDHQGNPQIMPGAILDRDAIKSCIENMCDEQLKLSTQKIVHYVDSIMLGQESIDEEQLYLWLFVPSSVSDSIQKDFQLMMKEYEKRFLNAFGREPARAIWTLGSMQFNKRFEGLNNETMASLIKKIVSTYIETGIDFHLDAIIAKYVVTENEDETDAEVTLNGDSVHMPFGKTVAKLVKSLLEASPSSHLKEVQPPLKQTELEAKRQLLFFETSITILNPIQNASEIILSLTSMPLNYEDNIKKDFREAKSNLVKIITSTEPIKTYEEFNSYFQNLVLAGAFNQEIIKNYSSKNILLQLQKDRTFCQALYKDLEYFEALLYADKRAALGINQSDTHFNIIDRRLRKSQELLTLILKNFSRLLELFNQVQYIELLADLNKLRGILIDIFHHPKQGIMLLGGTYEAARAMQMKVLLPVNQLIDYKKYSLSHSSTANLSKSSPKSIEDNSRARAFSAPLGNRLLHSSSNSPHDVPRKGSWSASPRSSSESTSVITPSPSPRNSAPSPLQSLEHSPRRIVTPRSSESKNVFFPVASPRQASTLVQGYTKKQHTLTQQHERVSHGPSGEALPANQNNEPSQDNQSQGKDNTFRRSPTILNFRTTLPMLPAIIKEEPSDSLGESRSFIW